MAKTLLHHPKPSTKIILQQMPLLTECFTCWSCWKIFLDTTSAPERRPWLFKSRHKVLTTK